MRSLEPEPPAGLDRGYQLVVEAEQRHDVPGGALQEDTFAAAEPPHRLSQPAGIVRRVADVVHAGRHRVSSVTDDRRDRAAIPAHRLQHRNGLVHQPARIPADLPHETIVVTLAAVYRQGSGAEAPAHRRVLEPRERSRAGLHDRVVQGVDVHERRVPQAGVVLAERAVDAAAAGRRMMGVVPVEQHAGSRRTGERRNARADEIDLGTLDGQRVDAANDHTSRASFERGGRHLERGKLLRCRLMSPDDTDHR